MKKTFALAACAALSLAVAACGDDDDDASGDTSGVLVANTNSAGTEPDAAGATSADTGATEADGAGASEPAGTSEADPDLVADCEAFLALPTPDADPPEVGDEVSDEFRDAAQDVIDQFADLDLNTDAANAARDAFTSYLEEARDADEWTEELESAELPEDWLTFTQACVAAGAAA